MELEWTGERMVADEKLGKGIIEHLHRYAMAIPFVGGRKVLDLASGEGYDSFLLSKYALNVTGVDISELSVEHAKRKYQRPNLTFLHGSATSVPLDDKCIDVIVSFETLEHLRDHDKMMLEFHRILSDHGVLIISTPERENYSKVDPLNPYHLKELSFDEFSQLLERYFSYTSLFHQRYFNVSFLYPAKGSLNQIEEYSGDFSGLMKREFHSQHLFNIAVCSKEPLPYPVPASFFDGTSLMEHSIRKTYETQIHALRTSVSYRLGNFLLKPISFMKRRRLVGM